MSIIGSNFSYKRPCLMNPTENQDASAADDLPSTSVDTGPSRVTVKPQKRTLYGDDMDNAWKALGQAKIPVEFLPLWNKLIDEIERKNLTSDQKFEELYQQICDFGGIIAEPPSNEDKAPGNSGPFFVQLLQTAQAAQDASLTHAWPSIRKELPDMSHPPGEDASVQEIRRFLTDPSNQAAIQGITELDLDNEDKTPLITIPKEIRLFKGLKELLLSNNEIAVLPANIFSELAALETLNLENNWLTTLPPTVFTGLTALTDINLIGNRLEKLPGKIFEGLKLSTLRLAKNFISELNADIFRELTTLETLELDENHLKNLPPNIFSALTALETLNLSDNEFERLPVNIFRGLSNLDDLNISDNKIEHLDESTFDGLNKLKNLDLDNNLLTNLPLNLSSKSLTRLSLNSNKISELHESTFSGLVNLEYLNLSKNPLRSLPLNLFKELRALKKLNLYDNVMVLTPLTFKGLDDLRIGIGPMTSLVLSTGQPQILN